MPEDDFLVILSNCLYLAYLCQYISEPLHEKKTKKKKTPSDVYAQRRCRSACAFWIAKDVRFLLVYYEDFNKTARMRRLIWVFLGRACRKKRFLTLRPIFFLEYLIFACIRASRPRWLRMRVQLETRRSRVRGRQHSFVEIDHEIFSTVILSLPLIQEGQFSVSGQRMCTIQVNRLED